MTDTNNALAAATTGRKGWYQPRSNGRLSRSWRINFANDPATTVYVWAQDGGYFVRVTAVGQELREFKQTAPEAVARAEELAGVKSS